MLLVLSASLSETIDDTEELRERDEFDLERQLLYCLLTAQKKSRAGKVSESLRSSFAEGSNPKPKSKHALSSSTSSSVTDLTPGAGAGVPRAAVR